MLLVTKKTCFFKPNTKKPLMNLTFQETHFANSGLECLSLDNLSFKYELLKVP